MIALTQVYPKFAAALNAENFRQTHGPAYAIR